MTTNAAAWIDEPYGELTIRDSPYPQPGPGQLTIRVRAVAINPLDAIIQSNGRVMYGWLKYPAILGEDVAGDVVEVGSGVERFDLGDRVLAYALGIERGRDQVGEGGFQRFVVVDQGLAAAIPVGSSFEEVSVLPLAISTAAAALFEPGQLALDRSSLDGTARRDEIVIVWGGTTSVGSNAIQLARAAGYRVITTASPRNHDLMRTLGAEAVFDYRAPDVVSAVIAAARGSRVAGVVAIAVGSGEPCVAIAAGTGAKRVALTSPSVSFYDQPRSAGISWTRTKLLARLIGGNVVLQARCALHGIRARFVWGSDIARTPVGAAVWSDYLPAALAEGRHIVTPPARVIGHGLGSVQDALDEMRRGVSAEKLVVTVD